MFVIINQTIINVSIIKNTLAEKFSSSFLTFSSFSFNIQLAFLGGMKVGLEALIHGLEVVAENNNGQVSFEFVKMVSASTIADVELKLSSIENGKGLIDALNNKSE